MYINNILNYSEKLFGIPVYSLVQINAKYIHNFPSNELIC